MLKTMKTKIMLRKLIVEAARDVILEHQHEQHEQQEMAQFKMIKDRIDQLIVMHQKGAYEEAKELELIRQIKKIAIEIEARHTGTKITANEKFQPKVVEKSKTGEGFDPTSMGPNPDSNESLYSRALTKWRNKN